MNRTEPLIGLCVWAGLFGISFLVFYKIMNRWIDTYWFRRREYMAVHLVRMKHSERLLERQYITKCYYTGGKW